MVGAKTKPYFTVHIAISKGQSAFCQINKSLLWIRLRYCKPAVCATVWWRGDKLSNDSRNVLPWSIPGESLLLLHSLSRQLAGGGGAHCALLCSACVHSGVVMALCAVLLQGRPATPANNVSRPTLPSHLYSSFSFIVQNVSSDSAYTLNNL